MDQWLLFALLGTGTGALYGALALGIVLVYRGSGVVNFAQVAMATYPAFIYADLRRRGRLFLPVPVWDGGGVRFSWTNSVKLADRLGFWPAFLLALAVAALMGWLIERLVFRPLAEAPSVTKVIASLGVNAAVLGLIKLQWGPRAGRRVDQILPHGNIEIFGVTVDYNRFVLAGIAVLGGLGLWALYRWTTFGLATTAASQSVKGVQLLGMSPARISSMNWVLGGVVAGAFGILAAPIQGVSINVYGKYLAFALAAAMAARLRSFPVAALTGIALGSFEALSVKIKGESWLPGVFKGGFESAVPFVVIVAVLVLGGTTLPGRGSVQENPSPSSPMPRFNPWVLVPALGAAVAVVLVGSSHLQLALTQTLIVSVFSLSFVLMAGFVGQVTLAELTFAGIAAFGLARLADRSGIPFPWSPALAIAISTALAVMVSFPAVRMRGLQLAVVTYSGAIALEEVVFRNPDLTGVGNLATAPAPELFGWGFGPASGKPGDFPYPPFLVFVLLVTVAMAVLVVNVRRSSLGRRLLAVRGNERAAASAGVAVPRTKLLGASLGCFVAACAGVLWAYKYMQFNGDTFAAVGALDFLAFAYIGGITMVSGAFVAGFFCSAGVFYALINDGKPPLWYSLAYGVGLVVVAVRLPGGLASVGPAARRWWARQRAGSPVHPGDPAVVSPSAPVPVPIPAPSPAQASTP